MPWDWKISNYFFFEKVSECMGVGGSLRMMDWSRRLGIKVLFNRVVY